MSAGVLCTAFPITTDDTGIGIVIFWQTRSQVTMRAGSDFN
jgi:hypothetical protein